jgi:superfamily II DNA or RNA helicase
MDVVRVARCNETYDKIICDPGIAQEISEYFTFTVPGAKFTPAYKNKLWDGKFRIFKMMHGLLYCGLRPKLEEFCRERNYIIEYDFDTTHREFSLVEGEAFAKSLGLTLDPREYQMKAFVSGVREGRVLFLSPTASGKSLIIYLITRYYNTKTLVVVPTVSLVHQMVSDFESYSGKKEDAHKIHSGQDRDTNSRIVVTTWQAIYKQPKSWFDQFEVVIGDEAHLFKAKSMTTIMEKMSGCRYKFGFTGTLDGTLCHELILQGLFGPVKRVTTTAELIEQKHLADFRVKSIVLTYPDDIRKQLAKASYQDEIDFLVRNEKRNRFLKNLALSLDGNTLLLFQYVEKHGKILYDDLLKACGEKRRVFFVYGGVDGAEREEIRAIVERESNAIIVASYGTFSTGVNIKNLSSVIFASPSKSRIRNLQSIGRGLRRSETKTAATLYDIADDIVWKTRKNYTLLHFLERIKIYAEEKFPYKIYRVGLE